MTTRTAVGARSFAAKEHNKRSENWKGMCLRFTRMCFDVPSAGLTEYDRRIGAKARSAYGAWTVTEHKHLGDPNPPAGVPVFWKGGSKGFGHVAYSDGDGYIWTNDLARTGQIDRIKLTEVHRKWGQTYLGWAEDINGVRVYNPVVKDSPAKPAPTPLVSTSGLPQGGSGLPAGHLYGPNAGKRASWHDHGPAVVAIARFVGVKSTTYDKALVSAVKAWQKVAAAQGTKIRTDGYVDEATWQVMARATRRRAEAAKHK